MTLSNSAITTTVPMTVGGNLTMGNGKNIVLQSATGYTAPVSGQLGSITRGEFSTDTALQNLTWKSTPAFTISPGHYIVSIYIQPKPGINSNAIFSNARITITDTALNAGTGKYEVYDPTTKPNLSYGNLPYLAIYSYSTVIVNTASVSLYLNIYPNFTFGGVNAPYLNTGDGVSFMRIA